MDTVQRTSDILTAAENAFAALVAESTAGRKYEEAAILIQLTRELTDFAERARSQLAPKPLAAPVPPARSKRPPASAGEYPRFLREGDSLVKIGWSKSERAEYEHKCPRSVLPLLAAAIAKAGANGKRFGMDKVLPLNDTDNHEIPAYQVYLALAFLRSVGLLEQHGRQGYTLTTRADIGGVIDRQWGALPNR
jgi:hypothetical protein